MVSHSLKSAKNRVGGHIGVAWDLEIVAMVQKVLVGRMVDAARDNQEWGEWRQQAKQAA